MAEGATSLFQGVVDVIADTDGPPIHAFKAGDRGAIIAPGETFTMYREPGLGGEVLGSDFMIGEPCEILATLGKAWLQIRIRNEDDTVEGWVLYPGYRQQPDLPTEAGETIWQDFEYAEFPVQPVTSVGGGDVGQGYLGDCYFVAGMGAVANAFPDAILGGILADPKKKVWRVRFFERMPDGSNREHWIEVDGYLPTSAKDRTDPVYAQDPGNPLWPAIVEKAYAEYRGGYDVLNEGGQIGAAMETLTGFPSSTQYTSDLDDAELMALLEHAEKEGTAVCFGSLAGLEVEEVQTPLKGSGSGPYKGKVSHFHEWNEIMAGGYTTITDVGGNVASAWDNSAYGDATGSISGSDVEDGSIDYKESELEVTYEAGKEPDKQQDLEVSFYCKGMIYPDKVVVSNHAYIFREIDAQGMIVLQNPWGSYHPKPMTAAEVRKYFSMVDLNGPPAQEQAP